MTGQGSFWFGTSPFYPGVATRSLRFDDGDSAHLTFTPSSASSAADRRKITHSVWIKRGNIGTYQTIYSSTKSGGGDYYSWRFNDDNTMTIFLDVDDSNFAYDGTEVYRDTSNWYHFVLIIDTTQSSASNRIKLYANGVQQTLSNKYGSDVSQNFETYVMDGTEDAIGEFNFNNTVYFDGYMCDFITTVGQDTSISDFGETKNGVWIAKDYSGSYGANGFRLQFDQTGTGTASASTIGADVSGNTNHWTSNNLAASDSNLPDSPENNFATMNPLQNIGITHSEGNLDVNVSSGFKTARSTFYVSSGRWYWEVRATDAGNGFIGVSSEDEAVASRGGEDSGSAVMSSADGDIRTGGDESTSYGNSVTDGDVLGVALDMVDGKLYISENGVFHNSGDPVNGTNPAVSNLTKAVSPSVGLYDNEDYRFNFGQDDTFAGALSSNGVTGGGGKFRYAPPAGYKALCSSNLPDVTIGPDSLTQADDHFVTHLYTANNQTAQTITGVGMQPDWLWFKQRNRGDAHALYNTSMGIDISMRITNDAEFDNSNSETGVTAVGADGFTLGTDNQAWVNYQSDSMVVWLWKANGGTTSSNTEGSKTVTVQANTTAGFSMITYSGDTSSFTLGHGLDFAPEWIIAKSRTHSERWVVFHGADDQAYYYLNDNFARSTGNADERFGNSTSVVVPSATLVTVGANNSDISKNGENYIMYCFHSVEGYSKFGSYTGNGSTDGTFVHTGFRPAWVLIKQTNSTGSWVIHDNKRSPFNVIDEDLFSNLISAESDNGVDKDFLSNGFKHRASHSAVNGSGSTYIYMAFAEQPFKFSNAR